MYMTTSQPRSGDGARGHGADPRGLDPGRRNVLLALTLGGGLFCVHFSADGREHGMWFIEPDDGADDTRADACAGRLPAELSARWQLSPRGIPRAEVCRRGDVLCEALLLTEDEKPADPGETRIALSARHARDGLRAEGLTALQASMLAGIRQRPLLATVARRAELPPATARQVHRLLLSSLCDPGPAPRATAPAPVAPVALGPGRECV